MLWFVPAAFAAPAPLATYPELLAALEAGETVRAIIHYQQCLLPSTGGEAKAAPDAIGGLTFTVFEAFAKGSIGNPSAFVSTSETRLIHHRSYGVVLNYGRLKVYEDGRAEVLAMYIDPRKHKIVMEEKLGCALGEQSGVQLFADR